MATSYELSCGTCGYEKDDLIVGSLFSGWTTLFACAGCRELVSVMTYIRRWPPGDPDARDPFRDLPFIREPYDRAGRETTAEERSEWHRAEHGCAAPHLSGIEFPWPGTLRESWPEAFALACPRCASELTAHGTGNRID